MIDSRTSISVPNRNEFMMSEVQNPLEPKM